MLVALAETNRKERKNLPRGSNGLSLIGRNIVEDSDARIQHNQAHAIFEAQYISPATCSNRLCSFESIMLLHGNTRLLAYS